MGTLYKIPNGKLTKDDGTLIKRGVFYAYGADEDIDDYDYEGSVSECIRSANRRQKFNGLNSSVLTFAPLKSYAIPGDFPQVSPYSAAGIFNPIMFNDFAGHATYFRFYPDATDNSFYMRIKVSEENNPGSFEVTLIREGANALSIRVGAITTTFDFIRSNITTGSAYICLLFLPWKFTAIRDNTRITTMGICYGRGINIQYKMSGEVSAIYTTLDCYVYSHNDQSATWNRWVGNYDPEIVDTDNPYSYGGTSEEGGGNGNFSEESDTPETETLPTVSAQGTGFATIFKPTIGQLKNLSELFWNSNVFTFLQNLVENITDMFTSLAILPFDIDAGRTVSVTWLGLDTAVSLTLAAEQYYEFDMGTINMADDSRIFTSGSVLDYSPFSKLGIYLPFIGYQELDIDECRNALINLRYRVDILSGACVAILKIDGRDLYQFTGNCLIQIPITNESMQSLVSDAVNVGIAAAGVGATGASVGADLAEAATSKRGIEYADIANAHRSITRAESGLASASANAVIGSKPTFNKSGAISSSSSMLAVKQPYLFLSTPRQSIPEHYQRYRGFPSNITSKLGDLSGFTVVEDIRLNGLVATSPEVAEIYDLLKKGVII